MPGPQGALPADEHTEADVYRDYTRWLDTLVVVTRLLANVPLTQMAAANERMQTLAPFVTPPLHYAKGASNLETQRTLIRAATAVQQVVRELPT